MLLLHLAPADQGLQKRSGPPIGVPVVVSGQGGVSGGLHSRSCALRPCASSPSEAEALDKDKPLLKQHGDL